MNTGRDAEELIKAGLMRDLTPIADEIGLKDFYADKSLLEPCTYEGKIYCFPVNIHSWDWLWLSTKAYEKINTPVPKDWNEYVASWPKLADAGIIEFGLATGWPIAGVPGVLQADVGGKQLSNDIFIKKSVDAVRGPDFKRFADALDKLRGVIVPSEEVPLFADVGVQLLKGEAAGNIHGDWLQADLQVAGSRPGRSTVGRWRLLLLPEAARRH
jgi:glucose/mannose transport system substrate-binding protein